MAVLDYVECQICGNEKELEDWLENPQCPVCRNRMTEDDIDG